MPPLWLVMGLALGAPGTAPAVEPGLCDPQNPKHCATPILCGQAAPFDGQLLTTDLATELGLKADECDSRIYLESDFAKKLAGVDLSLEKQLRKIDQDACRQSVDLLTVRLEQAIVPWYERPWFVAGATFVLTVGATALAVWGAGQLAPR